MKQLFSVFISVVIFILYSMSVSAGIALDGTRIIFNANDISSGTTISVTSSQNSNTPYLVKTAVSLDLNGEKTDTPFITYPSFFRLDPGNTNQVRIQLKQNDFPLDRESLFYFRAISMPTTDSNDKQEKSSVGGSVQLASGNIIKLFYRPNGLVFSQSQAMGKLQFYATQNGVKVSNPTPYYITISNLKVNGKGINIRTNSSSNMLAPFETSIFTSTNRNGDVEWDVINDYGGQEKFHGTVQ